MPLAQTPVTVLLLRDADGIWRNIDFHAVTDLHC
jgi:hypothetical protein